MNDQELSMIRTVRMGSDQEPDGGSPTPEELLMSNEMLQEVFDESLVRDILTFYLIRLPEGSKKTMPLIPVLSLKQLMASYGDLERTFITCVPFKTHFNRLDATSASASQALDIFEWSHSFGFSAAQVMALICDPGLNSFGGELPSEDDAKEYLTDGLDEKTNQEEDYETVDITDEEKYPGVASHIIELFDNFQSIRERRIHAPYFIKRYFNNSPGDQSFSIDWCPVSQYLLKSEGFPGILTSDQDKVGSIEIWLRHTCDLEFNPASTVKEMLKDNQGPAVNALKTQALIEIALWEYLSTFTPPGIVQLIGGLKEFQKLTPLTIARDINKEAEEAAFVVAVPENLEEFMNHCLEDIPTSVDDNTPNITRYFYKIVDTSEMRDMITESGTLLNAFASISQEISATIVEVSIFPRPFEGNAGWLIMFETDYECTDEENGLNDCRVSHGLNTIKEDFEYIPIYEFQYARVIDTLSSSILMGAIHLDKGKLENAASAHLTIQSEQGIRQAIRSEIEQFGEVNDQNMSQFIEHVQRKLEYLPETDSEDPVFFPDEAKSYFIEMDNEIMKTEQSEKPQE